ncbi:hypothetical protein IL306_007126 [Fusarium sp. DS 682]|nr:hypothetical protein IL306_007126 [Fusarium sp. DS 682]
MTVLAYMLYPFTHNTTSTTVYRNLPTDASWPSVSEWNDLNTTVGGRLIATIPLAVVCHDPNFDEAKCNVIKKN